MPRTDDWDPQNPPNQTGRVVLITGANAGLGYFASEQLARAGAHVILSGRSPERLAAAAAALRRRVPGASVEILVIDTADRSSVSAASTQLVSRDRLDAVVMNAGIVHPPKNRELSVDGDELVVATNVLGHFALAAALLPVLERTPGSRIVWLGSMSTRLTPYDPVDVQLRGGYSGWRAYAQSKMVVQLVGFELDRRLRAAGSGVASVVVHPGYSTSGRTQAVRGVNAPSRGTRFADNLQAGITQSKERGAWPTVRAVAEPSPSESYGPRWVAKGAPVPQRLSRMSESPGIARRVWADLETETGVTWPIA